MRFQLEYLMSEKNPFYRRLLFELEWFIAK